MSAQVKFWLQSVVAFIGAASAALSQYYNTDPASMPEAVRLTMLIGGVVATVLGGILAQKTLAASRRMDVDGDGVDETVIEDEK
jgi:hypothetical protein